MNKVISSSHQRHPQDISQVFTMNSSQVWRIVSVLSDVFEDVHEGCALVERVLVSSLHEGSNHTSITEDIQQHPQIHLFVLPGDNQSEMRIIICQPIRSIHLVCWKSLYSL